MPKKGSSKTPPSFAKRRAEAKKQSDGAKKNPRTKDFKLLPKKGKK